MLFTFYAVNQLKEEKKKNMEIIKPPSYIYIYIMVALVRGWAHLEYMSATVFVF